MAFTVNEPGHVAEHNRLATAVPETTPAGKFLRDDGTWADGTVSDAGVAALIPDTGTATGAALQAAFVTAGHQPGGLERWHRTLAERPATAKVVLLGDSTSVESIMQGIYDQLRNVHTQSGMPLAGMMPSNIVAGGNNGWRLQSWLADAAGPNSAPYSMNALISDAPDLIVLSFGLNDVRDGSTTTDQMVTRLESVLSLIAQNIPDADVLLRMPNSLTTTMVGTEYVSNITHQDVTDRLRAAYRNMRGRWAFASVTETQNDLFGTLALPTSNMMQDELHPNVTGQKLLADYLAFNYLGSSQRYAANAPVAHRFIRQGFIGNSGPGYIDLGPLPAHGYEPQGREWPLTPSDILVIDGSGSLPLASATFTANGANLRILLSGDYTTIKGKTFSVYGDHPDQGMVEGRYFATIDPGSVPPGATLDVTTTITGITREMGVLVQPPSAIFGSGLMWSAAISADNTVTIRLFNPTATAIDLANNAGWRFWIAR